MLSEIAVDLTPDQTTADRAQGAVQMNKVLIFINIKIKIIKINVQVVMPSEIAVDLNTADQVHWAVQINKVSFFINI